MSAPKASDDLHGYKAWRRSLQPAPMSTIIRWVDDTKYSGSTQADDILKGQMFILEGVRDPLFGVNECDADKIYLATQCTKTGKKFKRTLSVSVEGVARWYLEDKIEILGAS